MRGLGLPGRCSALAITRRERDQFVRVEVGELHKHADRAVEDSEPGPPAARRIHDSAIGRPRCAGCAP